jgi:hypothetical protein
MITLSLITALRFGITIFFTVDYKVMLYQLNLKNKKPQQLAGAGIWRLMNYFNLINSGLTCPKL